jgi:hypothetical protein
MKIVRPVTFALLAAVVFSGCSSSASPPNLPPSSAANPSGLLRVVLPFGSALPPRIFHPDRRPSWIATDAAKQAQLLFETDIGIAAVNIFALPGMRLEGQITGLSTPTGDCSDNHGNVWIAELGKSRMLKYSRAGKLLHTIARANLEPWGCAVNPINGALAVTNYEGPQYQSGDVLVYANPSAHPVILRNPEQAVYLEAAWDRSGNLWVTGYTSSEYSIISECGASKCRTVILHGGSIFSPSTIAWNDRSHSWVVFDQYCHNLAFICSYPVSTHGAVGKPTQYLSSVGGALCQQWQPALVTTGKETVVVGGDNEYYCLGYKSSSVNRWAYPAGGRPANYNTGAVVFPWGAAVSTR